MFSTLQTFFTQTDTTVDPLESFEMEDHTADPLALLLNETTNLTTIQQMARSARKTTRCQDDELMWMRYVTNVMIALPMASLGMLANVVSFVVLRRQRPKLTTTVLLQGLALADTAVLLVITLLYSLRYVNQCGGLLDAYMESYSYIFRWLYPAVYFFRMTSTWLTVLLTIDRYIAVCHPLQAQSICTIKGARRHMLALTLAAFLCSLPRFFEYQMKSGKFTKTELLTSKWYTIGYGIVVFFVLMYLLPMILMVTLNSRLLRALYNANTYRTTLQQSNPQTRANNRSITIVVLIIVLLCVISDSTGIVAHILYAIKVCFGEYQRAESFRRYLSNIRNIIIAINSAGNFVIYCLCSRNFRLALRKTFTCTGIGSCLKKKKKQKKKAIYIGPTYFFSLSKSSSNNQTMGNSHSNESRCNYCQPIRLKSTKGSSKMLGLSAVPMLPRRDDQRDSNSHEKHVNFYMKQLQPQLR